VAARTDLVGWLATAPLVLWRRLGRELAAFGAVGAVAFVVDVGLFNLLRFHGEGVLVDKPVTAKIISTSVATLVAWAGNRWWTYRGRRRPALVRELALFGAMNAIALVIAVLCLAVSHYVLQLRSPLADNISANFVGVGLGTAFRFVAYRLWVFRGGHAADAPAERLAQPPASPRA
jgi:putative flippase GtrA